MGEEKKEEAVEEKKEEVKEEKKEEEEKKKKKDEEEKEEKEKEKEIVLKVDMHCEACARKVARSLKGFQGVEEVKADCKASRVVVKGKGADPVKVSQRITKKSGRKVEIISPLPKNKEEEDDDDDKKKKQEENKDPQPKPDNKQEPPPVITVVLKVRMHCEACAQVLQKKIRKIKGVESVTTDISNDRVIVKGVLDPDKLVNDVYKRTGKQALIVKDEDKKEEEKKEEEKKDSEEKKKESEENKEEDDDKKVDSKKMEHWPSKYYMEHYSYAPQMFSDENPNACVVM